MTHFWSVFWKSLPILASMRCSIDWTAPEHNSMSVVLWAEPESWNHRILPVRTNGNLPVARKTNAMVAPLEVMLDCARLHMT